MLVRLNSLVCLLSRWSSIHIHYLVGEISKWHGALAVFVTIALFLVQLRVQAQYGRVYKAWAKMNAKVVLYPNEKDLPDDLELYADRRSCLRRLNKVQRDVEWCASTVCLTILI